MTKNLKITAGKIYIFKNNNCKLILVSIFVGHFCPSGPDPDTADQTNADPCGSGFETFQGTGPKSTGNNKIPKLVTADDESKERTLQLRNRQRD
jgi:hypothetical protein